MYAGDLPKTPELFFKIICSVEGFGSDLMGTRVIQVPGYSLGYPEYV